MNSEKLLPILLLTALAFPAFAEQHSKSSGLPAPASAPAPKKKEILFIKALDAKEGIDPAFTKDFRNKLVLYFFQEAGEKYRVLSEDDIQIMYKQAHDMLASGCDAEHCIQQIAYAIDADVIVYGEMEKKEGKIHAFVQSIVRDRKTDDLLKGSVIDVSFFQSQTDHFAGEIVKKLISPGYFIDTSKAPTEMKIELNVKELRLPGLKGLDISVMEFKTNDESIGRILDYSKALVKEGDDNFKDKNYETALSKYGQIIQKIETKLPESKQEKLANFKSSVEDRIVSSYGMVFKAKIEDADSVAKSGGYDAALSGYEDIKEKLSQIKGVYKNKLNDLRDALSKRLDSVYLLQGKYSEKQGDAFYSEYKFNDAIAKYEAGLSLVEKALNKQSQEYVDYKTQLTGKKDAANKTGYSYFKNTIKSYCDLFDFYNFSDQETKAQETLSKAQDTVVNSRWCNDSEVIKEYNERAKILKEQEISKGVCPGVENPDASGQPVSARGQVGKAGIEWTTIPGGSFMMGSADSDLGWSRPTHRVTVKSFQMAKTLVTNKQYKACVAAGACTPPDSYGASFDGDDHPVVGVDWNQAKTFCEWVGGRLPSEAEWEYAARSAGKDWRYPWGNEDATCERAVIGDCGYNATAPVCSKPAGNTKQGLCDMAGNVWEWVQDWWHDSYNGAPTDGSAWESPEGSLRVFRGGSWGYDAGHVRSADRNGGGPGSRNVDLGFRPLRSSR